MPAEGYYWCMSLLLKDRSFLERWAKQIEPEDFPDGPLRILSATVLAYWFEHRQLLTRPALRATLEEYTTEDNTSRILGYYEELLEEYPVDDESLPRLRELAAQWLERRWVGRAVDSALNALEIGKTKKALDSLLGVRRVLAEDEPPLSTTRSDWDKRTVYTPQMDIAIPTKLAELDDLWDGGIHPGEFAILLASTNLGKSMCLAYLAAQAFKANKKVLFFTFELSPTQIARRFMGALFQQPVIKLPRESRSMIQAYAEEHNLTRASFEVREDIETVNDLRTMLEQMQKEGNLPDVVFLDSADDLHMRSEKLYEGLSEIYTSLRRDITRNFGVALWTSTQATRDAVDKARVNLKQVADCFVKARRCHLMIGFSQTEEELNNTEGEGLPKLKLFVLKDSLHGSRGRGYAMYATFGRGSDGYPGFKWIKADAFADFIDEE